MLSLSQRSVLVIHTSLASVLSWVQIPNHNDDYVGKYVVRWPQLRLEIVVVGAQ